MARRPQESSTGGQRYAGRVAPTVVLAVAVIGIAVSADSSEPSASASPQERRSLEFGIYPGGAAGTVGPAGAVRPEVAELRLAALRTLRGGARPFVVHLYDSYRERADRAAVPGWLASQIAAYAAEGFTVELVLTYRPRRPTGDVAGFAGFVRARVRQTGANLRYLQVTNEANVTGAPDAADGAYRGARAALVRGVIAARDEARRRGLHHLRIGFNWAYQLGRSERAFFASLWRRGGRRFATAVDWVGLNSYPGTWGPALGAGDLGVRCALGHARGDPHASRGPAAACPPGERRPARDRERVSDRAWADGGDAGGGATCGRGGRGGGGRGVPHHGLPVVRSPRRRFGGARASRAGTG